MLCHFLPVSSSHLRGLALIKIMAAPSAHSGITSTLTAPVNSHLRDYTLTLRQWVATLAQPERHRQQVQTAAGNVTVIKQRCVRGDRWRTCCGVSHSDRTGCRLRVEPPTWAVDACWSNNWAASRCCDRWRGSWTKPSCHRRSSSSEGKTDDDSLK